MAACLMMVSAVNAQQEQPAEAQQRDQAQQAGAQHGSAAMKLDKIFLKQAAIGNMFEIQLSELAQQKAQDEKVKQFAQMMVQDHNQAKQKLQQVAQKKQVNLPSDLPELKQEELQAYQQLEGSEFDQAYLSCMKVAHAKDVALFQEKAKHAKDQDVKQFAQQALPKLQQHKQQVMAMTGGSDDAQTAGSREDAEKGAAGTSSSGSGSRQTGSGTITGGGTTGAGSSGTSSEGQSQ